LLETGSVARVHPPKPTDGVEPDALDQLFPFQSQVAELPPREEPQLGAIAGVPWAPDGCGAFAGTGLAGGIHLVDPEPVDPVALPDPPEPVAEQTTPPARGTGSRRSPPTSSRSWLTGSKVICAPESAGGEVDGWACVHTEPSQIQVSPRLRGSTIPTEEDDRAVGGVERHRGRGSRRRLS